MSRDTMPRISLVGALLVAMAVAPGSPVLAQTGPSGPALTVSAQAVTATGMTPGGTVVWLEMARKIAEYEPLYLRQQGEVQADAQGQAQLPVTETVPPVSIWIAVDLKTGAYATASPAGFSPLVFALAPGSLEVRGATLPDQLLDAADYAEVLLVRPGTGAWGKTVGRGGGADESDPSEPAFRLSLDRLDPLLAAHGPAPGKLQANDLIFVLHPAAMAIAAAAVGVQP
jgi:hypothetical protein